MCRRLVFHLHGVYTASAKVIQAIAYSLSRNQGCLAACLALLDTLESSLLIFPILIPHFSTFTPTYSKVTLGLLEGHAARHTERT